MRQAENKQTLENIYREVNSMIEGSVKFGSKEDAVMFIQSLMETFDISIE